MSATHNTVSPEAMLEETRAARGTAIRFAAILTVPFLAMAILISLIVNYEIKQLERAGKLVAAQADIRTIDAVIGALQKERGLSSGYLTAEGARLGDRLSTQRKATDAQIATGWANLTPDLLASHILGPDARLRALHAEIDEMLAGLPQLRQDVSDVALSRDEAVARYTDIVMGLVRMAGRQGLQADRPMEALQSADVMLRMVAEYAGRERAAGTTTASRPFTTMRDLDLLTQLSIRQQTLLLELRASASENVRDAVAALAADAALQKVEALRAQIYVGQPASFTPEDWFAATTQKVDAIGAVRQEVARLAVEVSAAQRRTVEIEMTFIIVVAAVASVASLLVAYLFAHSMTRSLRSLTRGTHQISLGLSNIDLIGGDRSDMVGLLARSVSSVTRQGEENTRIRSALSVSDAQIMILNEKGDLIFINGALESSLEDSMDYFFEVLPDIDPFAMYDHVVGLVREALDRDGVVLTDVAEKRRLEVGFGDRVFDVAISPVTNRDGDRAGVTIEWREVTATRAIEAQISTIIEATKEGDFSGRLDVADTDKFLTDVSDGLNAITSEVEAFVSALKETLGALADGDLTRRLDRGWNGDLGALADATNRTTERLQALVSEIATNSGDIKDDSDKIREGAQLLAGKTEQGAAALKETATSMEEISSATASTASFAAEATAAAQEATERADQGGAVVQDAIKAMERIREHSHQIQNFVGTIDGIAFQTNLLALNAAVEAARAGEAGKGFAVVAAEVRTLAQQAADAAKGVRDLIEASAESVSDGSRHVEATGEALTKILDVAANASEKISQISKIADEQAGGVKDIAATIQGLDRMTQENAAGADANALHSKRMAAHADRLAELVAQFDVGVDAGQSLDDAPDAACEATSSAA